MLYDCFLFYNELDLLEIRFAELENVVDYFVIVEGRETFTGIPRKPILGEHSSRFRKWWDRIIYNVVRPKQFEIPMDREAYQRDHLLDLVIVNGLNDFDHIMISDIDEIPRAEKVVEAMAGRYPFKPFNQPMFQYYLNGFINAKWNGTVLTTRGYMKQNHEDSLHNVRLMRRHGRPLSNAGWHFSWLGGAEKVVEKALAYSHTYNATQELTDINRVRKRIAQGLDYSRDHKITWWPIDERFPKYVRENQEKFSHLIREVR